MAWRQTGDKPLFEPILKWFTDEYVRHLGGEELIFTSVIQAPYSHGDFN